jgi:hypothetical protein
MKPVREVTMADLDSISYTKKEAIALGVNKYLSSKYCGKRHRPVRYVSNDVCVACARACGIKGYYEKWEEKKKYFRDRSKFLMETCPEKVRAKNNAWTARNREKASKNSCDWAKRNPEKASLRAAQYRAKKIAAMPKWASQVEILKFYEKAKSESINTGVRHSVDHIVPLNSKIVCGLHCEFNLRVITFSENSSKQNRHWPDMP